MKLYWEESEPDGRVLWRIEHGKKKLAVGRIEYVGGSCWRVTVWDGGWDIVMVVRKTLVDAKELAEAKYRERVEENRRKAARA